jgi:hypothetical protein
MEFTQSDIDQLLAHLQSEFGSHGRRASDYLLTARNMLDWAKGREATAPRVGNAAAYCLREAMTEILNSQDDSGQSWRSLSREVVEAKQQYERVHRSGSEEQRALTGLIQTIDDLAKFHERESHRERRLIAVLFDRTGSTPVAGSTSVKRYQRTLQSLNSVVHGSTPHAVDQAERTWSQCLALLRKLFSSDERYNELGRLAKTEQPTVEHVTEVSELVISAAHLRYFLARIERPVWLDMLTDSGLLDPPENGEGWPAFVATERLARQYPAAVAHWLNKMYKRLSGNTKYISMIGGAALAIGDIGLPLVARIVRRHSAEPDVVRLSWDAARSANPSSDSFESFGDIVFNQQSSSFAWTFGEIAERFVSGIDSSNAMPRLQLIASKIRSTSAEDHVRSWHEHKPYGSIADRYDDRHDERFDVLIHALMSGTRESLQWVGIDSLLELMDTLPGVIGTRMRLWLLGNTPEVGVGVLIEEIAEAIGQRQPNGDDLPLIDRVVQTADPTQYEDRWREALGSAPDVEHVGRALAADEPREEWIRAFQWLPLLTLGTDVAWEDVVAVLSACYGAWSRDLLESKSAQIEGEIIATDSPFSVDELTSLSVEDACRRISSWRPREGEWMVDAHALSKTLERLVTNNPSLWVRNPLRIAMELRHPTYIHRYLVAICATLSENGAPIDKLIRLVALLRTHPWTPDSLGRSNFGYDTDWTNVDRTTIDIIESLAKKDLGFAGLSNQVWVILESAVRARSESTERTSVPDRRDPIDIAINLPRTKALWAVLEFMAYEFRSTNHVRAEAFCLLTDALRIGGDDGLYHRAILAANLGLLRNIDPEWTERTKDLLLGSDAPNGLGQKTLEQALKLDRPNKWLLEEFRCGVMDAVRRRVVKAFDHYLCAVLWDWNGYSLDDAAEFLGSQPELLLVASERLGYLLDDDGANQFHIERSLRFWKMMADKGERVGGLTGFGGFARVAMLDDKQWSELTLKTLRCTGGRIDEAQLVAERAGGLTPDDTVLEIMDNLVRRSYSGALHGKHDRIYFHTNWAQEKIEKAARELLNRSSELRDSDHYQRLFTALRERGNDI